MLTVAPVFVTLSVKSSVCERKLVTAKWSLYSNEAENVAENEKKIVNEADAVEQHCHYEDDYNDDDGYEHNFDCYFGYGFGYGFDCDYHNGCVYVSQRTQQCVQWKRTGWMCFPTRQTGWEWKKERSDHCEAEETVVTVV